MTKKSEMEMRMTIKHSLMRVGFKVDSVGFAYLCYAVELVIKNPDLIHNMCKGVYAKVGEKFCVQNDLTIERNIRYAIDKTYINKSFVELNHMFNMNLFTINDKPTNGELIKLMAEYYNMSLYKKDLIC